MNYSDEELSAFLDQELPADKMEAIRESIADDAALTDRLAMLSQVDAMVCEFVRQIDRTSAPQSLMELLTKPEQHAGQSLDTNDLDTNDVAISNVVAFGFWRQAENYVREHVAAAASVALIVGVAVGSVLFENPARTESSQWAEINHALHSLPSGERVQLKSGEELFAQFSFTTAANELCRSYKVTNQRVRQDVACRSGDMWQVVASAYQTSPEMGEYGVASASPIVDAVLLQLGAGATLSLAEERTLLENKAKR